MQAAVERPEFTPPPQPGLLGGLALALLAHLLLVMALAWGVQWNRDAQDMAVEAELWSSLPQEAAPKEVAPPPAPPAPPVVQAPAPDPQQLEREAQIALEREREKQEAQERREAERERERRRQEAEMREAERRKAEVERQRQEELARKREEEKLAAEKKRKEAEARKRREEQEEKRLAAIREENLNRIRGMAGGTGAPTSTGTAARSAGPSASWAGKVRARVRPNIVFADNAGGNPRAEVEVRLAPDGTIVGKRLVQPSGNKDWDQAVLRALDKTEVLPRDTDGSVPSSVVLGFRPRD